MAFLSKMENVAAMVASEKTKDEIIGVRNEPPEQVIFCNIINNNLCPKNFEIDMKSRTSSVYINRW